MAWNVLDTETAVGQDGQEWIIDLLTGEIRFATRPVGKALHGVVASAHRDEAWRFKVAAWVPEDRTSLAQSQAMADARRRIADGSWHPGEEYEVKV